MVYLPRIAALGTWRQEQHYKFEGRRAYIENYRPTGSIEHLKIIFGLGIRQYTFQITVFMSNLMFLPYFERASKGISSLVFSSLSLAILFQFLKHCFHCVTPAACYPPPQLPSLIFFSHLCFPLLLFVNFPSVSAALLKYNLHLLKGLQIKKKKCNERICVYGRQWFSTL